MVQRHSPAEKWGELLEGVGESATNPMRDISLLCDQERTYRGGGGRPRDQEATRVRGRVYIGKWEGGEVVGCLLLKKL